MYLPLLYCIKEVVCRLYEMLYLCICNVVISCWKSGAYGYVICRGGTDMCFVPGSGWKHLDLEQYHISGLTLTLGGTNTYKWIFQWESRGFHEIGPCRRKVIEGALSAAFL